MTCPTCQKPMRAVQHPGSVEWCIFCGTLHEPTWRNPIAPMIATPTLTYLDKLKELSRA